MIIKKYINNISGIFKSSDCGTLIECEDGTFSNSSGRGACAKHGGV